MNDKILFMTACINPNGMSNTAIQNVELRKKQYLDAVKFYLQKTRFRILFVENSGYDISSSFRNEIRQGRMEVITYEGNCFDRSLGKGYGEGLIVRQALAQSKWMKSGNAVVIKVSGRHVVKNINTIERIVSLFCLHKHYVACDINTKTRGANSDMFIATSDFFSLFDNYIERVDEAKGIWFEHVLYQAIVEYCKSGGNFVYLPLPLNQIGMSGSMGTTFRSPNFVLKVSHLIKFFMYKIRLKQVC